MSVSHHPSLKQATLISYDATHHSSAQAKFSFSKADRFPKVRGAGGN